LLTLSEIDDVKGEQGNFTVRVKKNPRFIEEDKCIACGLCAEKCPKKVPDEYNAELNTRKAAYIKYGQTVPLKYAVDSENCIYHTKGRCRACEKICPTGAINLDMQAEFVELNVGAVVLAPGFKPFSPKGIDYYGYDAIPDVVTSLEYERILSASGPSMGHLSRPSDGGVPAKIAWIQCVGSRNTNCADNGYCSSVCCMYSIKQAVMTGSHLDSDGEQVIFYMDIRAAGKDYERYYQSSKDKGVKYVKARPHTLTKGPDNVGVIMTWTSEDGTQNNEYFDMVVLAIGMEAPEDAMKLAHDFDFQLTKYNFAETNSFNPVSTTREGVFVTGAFHSPKAIPKSVIFASSAAADAETLLADSKGSLTKEKTWPEEIDIADQEPNVGVFVCSCGTNIAGVIDVKDVAEYASTLPSVTYVENNMFTCSTDTQDLIAEIIKEKNLNRVVIAACTPRTHEPLFQETLQGVGLNKYMIEMANIRNQNSWVHPNEPEKATAKAKDQIRMAVAKATGNYPLDDIQVNVTPKALVVGGGLAGLSAASTLATQGYETIVLEKEDKLGGVALDIFETWKGEDVNSDLKNILSDVEKNDRIRICQNTTLESVSGSVGSFIGKIKTEDKEETLEFGACVIATGGKAYTPDEYLYGQDKRVVTSLEFDKLLAKDKDNVAKAGAAVFIQCVGSRDDNRPYCSRVCCTSAVANAVSLKKMNPAMNVFILNRDIRTYADREVLYKEARDLGIIFISYTLDSKPEVLKDGKDILVKTFDPISRFPLEIVADYVVLSTAILPNDNSSLVEIFKCGVNSDGFLSEAHPKLKPVDSTVDGVFLAGLCHYPKPINESIAQGKAAASRAGVILSKKTMKLDAIKSHVTQNCDGCALCIDVCPYNAIVLNEFEDNGRKYKRISTDKALCKGCGICAATCPKEGVVVEGFTQGQLKAQVAAILEHV
jgi:heterodisulfide reductase subunit A2